MNELIMALNEGSGNDNNKLQIEHLFLLGSTKSMDKAFKRLTDGVLEFGRGVVECGQVVAVGVAVYLALLGTSHVIRAIREDTSTNGKKKKDKTRGDKTKPKDGSFDADDVIEES